MGGRLAMAYASSYPEMIEKLFLESTNVSNTSSASRKKRFSEDMSLCNLIDNDFMGFIKRWKSLPLFEYQKQRNLIAYEQQDRDRHSHNPSHLSKSLSIFSQGRMNLHLDDYRHFNFPIVLITGSEDYKYTRIGKKLVKQNTNARHCIIDSAMHNIHLESPREFMSVILDNLY